LVRRPLSKKNRCAGASVIFRRTASTSDKAAVRLKATSPKLANTGRAVDNEPDGATIAAAIVAARTNLLMARRIIDPVPRNQFDANHFQHRSIRLPELSQYFMKPVTMFIPCDLALAEEGLRERPV
jgi:hypothetical protein